MPAATVWAVHLAIAASLVTLLDNQLAAVWQLGMFGLAVGLNSPWMNRYLGKAGRSVRVVYLLLTIPVFLGLDDLTRMKDEWLSTRFIYLLLLGGIYLLPFLPYTSAADLRRIAIVLAACFFYSATFFRNDWFISTLLAALFALFVAFHAARAASSTPYNRVRIFRLAGLHLILTALGASVFFCGFPRAWFRAPTHAPRFSGGDQTSQSLASAQLLAQAGVSSKRDMLQLPNLLDFSRSGAEVMRIRMIQEPTGTPYYATNSLYLRAAIFETYAHGSWFSDQPTIIRRDEDDGQPDGWTRLRWDSGHTNGLRIRQFIQMNPLDDLCFALPDPLAINQPRIKLDTRGVLILPYQARMPLAYKIISELPRSSNDPALDTTAQTPLPEKLKPCLQIPPALRPFLERLRSRWDRQRSPARQAEQIRQFLHTQCEYGPVLFQAEEGLDPVYHFLTDSRRGYCSHFASAMALIARSIGLPSRVASGFHFIGMPAADGFYHICEFNAHAWTEIYFPGQGWIIFDATPPAFRPTEEKPGENGHWWQDMFKFSEMHNLLADFDSLDQKACLLWAREITSAALEWWQPLLSSGWIWLGLSIAGALLWVVFGRLPLRFRRRLAQGLRGQMPSCSVPFYEDLLWLLARHGHKKLPGLTGLEFADSLVGQFPQTELKRLTHQFYQVKYGAKALSPEDDRELQLQLAKVEAALSGRSCPARQKVLS